MSLQIPHRERSNGSQTPTKAVILVRLSWFDTRGIYWHSPRWEDLLEEPDSDHYLSMCQRYNLPPLIALQYLTKIATLRCSWTPNCLALSHRNCQSPSDPRSLHNRILRRVRFPRFHQRLCKGVSTHQDCLPSRVPGIGNGRRTVSLQRCNS